MIVEKKGAMYRMYETEFGIQMLRAQEKIRAVAADADTSELLGVKKNTPVLSVERISFTYSDKPHGSDYSNKRCRNNRLLESGFQFQYPDYQSGYRQVLDSR